MRAKQKEEVIPIGPDCGPHCLAQTVGLGRLIVQHCKRCHEEKDYVLRVRPKH